MVVQPYLFFNGRCDEALAFYQAALGAEVASLMRFRDNPDPAAGEGCAGGPPPSGDQVMHAEMRVGSSTILMSDGMDRGTPTFQGFALTLQLASAAEVERVFTRLADGGTVQMPIGATFFATSFGMVADRFGVTWTVIAPA